MLQVLRIECHPAHQPLDNRQTVPETIIPEIYHLWTYSEGLTPRPAPLLILGCEMPAQPDTGL